MTLEHTDSILKAELEARAHQYKAMLSKMPLSKIKEINSINAYVVLQDGTQVKLRDMTSNNIRHYLTTWDKVWVCIRDDGKRLQWTSYYIEKLYSDVKDSANEYGRVVIQQWYDSVHNHMTRINEDLMAERSAAQTISGSCVDKYRNLVNDVRTLIKWIKSDDTRTSDKAESIISKLNNKEY